MRPRKPRDPSTLPTITRFVGCFPAWESLGRLPEESEEVVPEPGEPGAPVMVERGVVKGAPEAKVCILVMFNAPGDPAIGKDNVDWP